jgi:CRP/FNR family transcriptional regulator, cyclic AMP receptor protein
MTGFEPTLVRQDWNRATDRDWAEVLARLPLFSRLGKRRLRTIARQAQFAEFAAGDTIVSARGPGDSLYVILSGEAKARGKRAARPLRAGDYFGEMALLDGEPRSATVLASEPLHVMRLPRRSFLQLAEQDPAIPLAMLAELAGRVRRLEKSD